MSVKNFLVVTAGVAVMSATTAMAGGPDRLEGMPAPIGFQNSIYLDGHLGYAQSNWSSFNANGLIGQSANSNYSTTSNGNGGFSGGLDFGYNFTRSIALEMGWFYLPKVNAAGTGISYGGQTIPTSSTANVSSWMLYLAGKLSVTVMDNLDLFGKIGVGYRRMNYDNVSSLIPAVANESVGYYWTPILGAGAEYTMDCWLFGVQYIYIPSDSNVNNVYSVYGAPNAAPAANLYTGFVGYKFTF